MTMSPRPSTPHVGRFTAIILGLVTFICVVMIGGTGYLKYQLDRAETLLAAPDSAVGSDQDLFDRLRRDLGYGGFLGLAQNYALAHDSSGFADMKAHIKSADEIIAHLPDRTPAETRHELAAIASVFDGAFQKINTPATETNNEFTSADLTPLYAALPILDARVMSANAETRLGAQNKMQFWAMLLTLVSWCSLIIAAACAAGIYLTLRDKHSAPMRALAQSIQNMARGDMRTAIWGIERQDMIGELARSVDIARYHFSHLPDLSLLSEQGPVRMRFEGGSRSLFEAMMKAISRDSENIRDQTNSLTAAVQAQKDTIGQMALKVETVLANILQNGQSGDQQIRHAIQEMVGSAESLKNAHAHAADQLNRLIPHIQERAQGMAEIAQITGKQIGQSLQSLASSETTFKANADQAKETFDRLASTADDLGERLFGAINLLQASGKVLSETTQNIQNNAGGEIARVTASIDSAALEPLAQRLEQITEQLSILQAKMNEAPQIIQGEQVSDGKFDLALLSGFEQLLADRIEPKLASLEQGLEQKETTTSTMALAELSGKISALAAALPVELHAHMQNDWQRLAAQMAAMQTKVEHSIEEQKKYVTTTDDSIITKIEPKLHALQTTIEQQAQVRDEQSRVDAVSMRQTIMDLSDKLTVLTRTLPDEIRCSVAEDMKQLSAQQDMTALSDKMNEVKARIEQISMPDTFNLPPQVLKQLDGHWYQMAAQIEASRSSIDKIIAEQVTAKIDALGQTLDATKQGIATTQVPASPFLSTELQKMLDSHWYQVAAQIEASRTSLAATISEQIAKMETRLASKTPDALSRSASDYATQRQIEQQTQILSELVATLGILDAHMQQIKSEMRATGP